MFLTMFCLTAGKWKVFITDDLEIGFNKLIETYQIRWSIKVFFNDAKQHRDQVCPALECLVVIVAVMLPYQAL